MHWTELKAKRVMGRQLDHQVKVIAGDLGSNIMDRVSLKVHLTGTVLHAACPQAGASH